MSLVHGGSEDSNHKRSVLYLEVDARLVGIYNNVAGDDGNYVEFTGTEGPVELRGDYFLLPFQP